MSFGLYLEFANRSGELLFRQPVHCLPAKVGRSLRNDFVLDDPYVAAAHLELEKDPEHAGHLLVRDLGSHNGIWLGGRRVQQARLRPGESLHLGHTQLRLRSADETLPPERPDTHSSRIFSLPTGLVLLAFVLLMTVLERYLGDFSEISAKNWFLSLLIPPGLILSWAAIWAAVTRLFAGRAQFGFHLAIAGWGLLGLEVLQKLLALGAYSFSLPALAPMPNLVAVAAATWVLFHHLSLAQLRWPRINLPLAALIAALPTCVWMMSNWEGSHTLIGERLVGELYAPALRVAPAISSEAFVKRIAGLRGEVDAVRHAGNTDDDGED